MSGATVTLSELPSFVTRDAKKTTEEVRQHQELGERTTNGVFNAVPGEAVPRSKPRSWQAKSNGVPGLATLNLDLGLSDGINPRSHGVAASLILPLSYIAVLYSTHELEKGPNLV